MFAALLAPGVVDEDAAHGLGHRRKEVAAVGPQPLLTASGQAQVSFVNEGCDLEGLPRLLVGQELAGPLAQLRINQRQQLAGGVRVVR
jgi:hypothetical protein